MKTRAYVVFLYQLLLIWGCDPAPKGISSSFAISKDFGSCLAIQYFEDLKTPPSDMKPGLCPPELQNENAKAQVLVRCESFRDQNKNEYQWVIYDKIKSKDGSYLNINETEAKQNCQQLKDISKIRE